MSNTWAAGWRGRTGRGLGFDLQPLVSQGLCKVVVHRHADGQLLGAGFLVVHAEASLEMLLHDVVVAAFGNHCWIIKKKKRKKDGSGQYGNTPS